jgi:hypothetical protein
MSTIHVESWRTQQGKGVGMSTEEPTQDPQDKAFGATASRDQEIVDALAEKGVTADELPDEPAHHPRAGGKAEPMDASNETGEGKAKQNREEEPPAWIAVGHGWSSDMVMENDRHGLGCSKGMASAAVSPLSNGFHWFDLAAQNLVRFLQLQDHGDPRQIEPRIEELADGSEAFKIVLAV